MHAESGVFLTAGLHATQKTFFSEKWKSVRAISDTQTFEIVNKLFFFFEILKIVECRVHSSWHGLH